MRKKPALAYSTALAALLILVMPAPAMASTSESLTEEEMATLTQIFGHEPSSQEVADYEEQFAQVPTAAEVDAYLNAAEGEESVTAVPASPTAAARANAVSDFFQSAGYIQRDGVWSLSLMPRAGGIGNEGAARTWQPVYNQFSRTVPWSLYPRTQVDQSMKKQYDCHYKYGMIKTPWNLELHKLASNINSITCN